MTTNTVDHAADTVSDVVDRYRHGHDRPLVSYAGLMGTYGAATAALAWLSRDRDIGGLDLGDMALLAGATHTLSRTITKDSVASPLRAPFTRFKGPAGPGEVNEEVIGTGLPHALGELVTCPFCIAQWVGTGLGFGFVLAPRASRFAASILTAVGASDFIQLAYAWGEQRAED